MIKLINKVNDDIDINDLPFITYPVFGLFEVTFISGNVDLKTKSYTACKSTVYSSYYTKTNSQN